jgi:hypothetical protein
VRLGLARKSLGHLAALDDLVSRAKNETAAAYTRCCKRQRMVLGHGDYHVVSVADIAGETTTHSKAKLRNWRARRNRERFQSSERRGRKKKSRMEGWAAW